MGEQTHHRLVGLGGLRARVPIEGLGGFGQWVGGVGSIPGCYLESLPSFGG